MDKGILIAYTPAAKIAKNITDNGIEIAGFQEVDNKTTRASKKEQIKEIANKTGYQYYKFFKAIDFQGGGYGLGIVSKYPIESTKLIKLSSGSAEQRILAHAVINVNGEKINFFVTFFKISTANVRQKFPD